MHLNGPIYLLNPSMGPESCRGRWESMFTPCSDLHLPASFGLLTPKAPESRSDCHLHYLFTSFMCLDQKLAITMYPGPCQVAG